MLGSEAETVGTCSKYKQKTFMLREGLGLLGSGRIEKNWSQSGIWVDLHIFEVRREKHSESS